MRSLLFIPADDEKKLAKGMAAGADALILDLEDAVAAPRKAAARALAAQYIADARPRGGQPRLYVRINALDTDLWQDDVAAVIGARPDGLLLPKPRSGDDVHRLSLTLRHEEERAGAPVGSTRIVAIATETPASLFQLHTYADSSSRLEALTWGAEDLSAAVGSSANREADGRTWTSPYRLARDLTLLAAAAAGVAAIDTVYVNLRDAEGLALEAQAAARDGFTGKMAIHPSQVATINAAFTPGPDEVAAAEEVVRLFADNPGAGALAHLGQMVDKPHLARAERTLARAKAASADRSGVSPLAARDEVQHKGVREGSDPV
jgi:citrate lyase subunit beta/citryl-CoA lyase